MSDVIQFPRNDGKQPAEQMQIVPRNSAAFLAALISKYPHIAALPVTTDELLEAQKVWQVEVRWVRAESAWSVRIRLRGPRGGRRLPLKRAAGGQR